MPDFATVPSPEALRTSMRALLGGLPLGAEVSGFRLVHVDVDEALAFVLERGEERVEVALSPRDDTLPHFAQTRSFNVTYFVGRLKERDLSPDGRRMVRDVSRIIAAHDNGRAAERLAPGEVVPGAEVALTRVDTLLAPTTCEGVEYYTANPYLGCLIGCGFCYAHPRIALIRRLMGLEERAWGRYVVAKENAPEILDRELSELGPLPVAFSPLVADVYQGVERRLGLTRRCLEVLVQHQARVYVLTRSTLVLRDLDLFQQIPGATVGFSVSTDDDAVGLAYEPRAARISERLEALGRLRAAGIRTVAVVQPILPMDPLRLADRLADVADAVRVDVYLPADVGGTPLEPVTRGAPPPPSPEAERALVDAVVGRLAEHGVPRWTGHVPP